MEVYITTEQARLAFAALSHEHRLSVYRLLVEAGPEGINAGAIAQRLGIPPSSLTFHVQHLQRAGLIGQRRRSRELIYSTDFEMMSHLVDFLTRNCCSRGLVDDGKPASRKKVARSTTRVA